MSVQSRLHRNKNENLPEMRCTSGSPGLTFVTSLMLYWAFISIEAADLNIHNCRTNLGIQLHKNMSTVWMTALLLSVNPSSQDFIYEF